MRGYLGFYEGKRVEIFATTIFDAKQQALLHFKPPKNKLHMVHVHLAEVEGEPVVHVPDF